MNSTVNVSLRPQLLAIRGTLVDWLVNDAYPRWAREGIDPNTGAFIEVLGQDGLKLDTPRRARVQPRQIYAFAQAARLGWLGDTGTIIRRGLQYFETHYRRDDGLFRTLADREGKPLDDRALLYDQAFALLGYAAAASALQLPEQLEPAALRLFQSIERGLGVTEGGCRSCHGAEGLRESNPHMHLLEACLAWTELGSDPTWERWVGALVNLAQRRFIRADSGALSERFTADWAPAPGIDGRLIEPGHQFEWAWLLLRCESHRANDIRGTALRLIEIGEEHGVKDGVAINSLLDDFSVHDPNARFWCQTERLKAALLAAQKTGDARYWQMARAAAHSFLQYIRTPTPGLWLDVRRQSGEMVDAPSPASTFYHIVCAIGELDAALC